MYIQDPMGKGLNERRADQTHITGQAYSLYTELLQGLNDGLVVGLPGGIIGLGQNPGCDAATGSPLQALDPGHIGDHHLDAGLQSSLFDSINQGLQVGPAAGYEHSYR